MVNPSSRRRKLKADGEQLVFPGVSHAYLNHNTQAVGQLSIKLRRRLSFALLAVTVLVPRPILTNLLYIYLSVYIPEVSSGHVIIRFFDRSPEL